MEGWTADNKEKEPDLPTPEQSAPVESVELPQIKKKKSPKKLKKMRIPPETQDEILTRKNIEFSKKRGSLHSASPKKKPHEVDIERSRGKGPISEFRLEKVSQIEMPKKKMKKPGDKKRSLSKKKSLSP